MGRNITRRKLVAGAAVAAGASALAMPSIAQAAPIKIGLLTVKTGPLAAGGVHAEEGITAFLKPPLCAFCALCAQTPRTHGLFVVDRAIVRVANRAFVKMGHDPATTAISVCCAVPCRDWPR